MAMTLTDDACATRLIPNSAQARIIFHEMITFLEESGYSVRDSGHCVASILLIMGHHLVIGRVGARGKADDCIATFEGVNNGVKVL